MLGSIPKPMFGRLDGYHHCNCLAQSIVKKALKNVVAGLQIQWTLKSIDKAVEAIVADLAEQTKKIGDAAEKNKNKLPRFLQITTRTIGLT